MTTEILTVTDIFGQLHVFIVEDIYFMKADPQGDLLCINGKQLQLKDAQELVIFSEFSKAHPEYFYILPDVGLSEYLIKTNIIKEAHENCEENSLKIDCRYNYVYKFFFSSYDNMHAVALQLIEARAK